MNSDNPENVDNTEIINEIDALSNDIAEESEDLLDSADATLDSVVEDEAKPLKANKKVKTAKRGGGIFSLLTFLLALAALAASAYNYWQQQEFTKSASLNLSAAEDSSKGLMSELQTELKNEVNKLTADNDELVNDLTKSNRQIQRDLSTEIEKLDDRLLETDAQIITLRGFSDAAKYAYVKAEIEYFLQTANNRIDLANDAGTALAALEAADERLGLLKDPSLRPVRRQVLDEIQALKAIEPVDIEKIALTLSSISKAVPNLSLRMDDDKDYFQEEIKLKEGTGFRVGMSNVWRNMRGTLDKLVEVRDATPSDVPLMSIEDLSLLFVNLDTQLQSARLASLKGDATNYQISLEGAENLLSVYFDTAKPEVASIIKSLGEIKDVKLSPELPDITKSLIMLRELRSADKAQANESSDE